MKRLCALVPPLARSTDSFVKVTVTGPVTTVPLVAESHGASERAVQLLWLAVEAGINAAPPAAPMVNEVLERVKVQEAGAGPVGPASQPDCATLHTNSNVPSRMAASLTGRRAACATGHGGCGFSD